MARCMTVFSVWLTFFIFFMGRALAFSRDEIINQIRPKLNPEVQRMVDWIEADPAWPRGSDIPLERILQRLFENSTYRDMIIADMRQRISKTKSRSYEFPCKPFNVTKKADTVHELTPYDIKVVGAMGDSLSAGNGIDAKTLIGVLRQYRYKAFSIGGYKTFEAAPTLPNILRKYNPKVIGASTGICKAGKPCSNLNMAVPGKTARDMAAQARELVEAMKDHPDIEYNSDWKMVTMFIGQNDICSSSCKKSKQFTTDLYRKRLQDALDILHREMPKAFVNIVTMVDAYLCNELNIGTICTAIHLYECPCGAFWPFHSSAKLLNEAYQKVATQLVESGRYDDRDDFTVVVQPFFQKTMLPRTTDGKVDLSYFSPDCFHFSAIGHAEAAKALWNSMVEPVGSKKTSWHIGEDYECPTPKQPYFFTNKNSRK